MSESVFDASVVLAILHAEPYDVAVLNLLPGAIISTINYCEVWTKLHEKGIVSAPRAKELLNLLRVEPFTRSHADIAADLRMRTRHLGLSLGDRACLALGMELGADVFTAERRWAQAGLKCRVQLIR